MSGTTPTWGLLYPTDTNRFCEGHLFTQRLAEQVDEILDGFDADTSFLANPPMVIVQGVSQIDDADNLQFASVLLDNANLVNLSIDADQTSTVDDAFWVSGGSAHIGDSAGAAGNRVRLVVDAGGFVTGSFGGDNTQRVPAAASTVRVSSTLHFGSNAGGTTWGMSADVTGSSLGTITVSEIYGFYHWIGLNP